MSDHVEAAEKGKLAAEWCFGYYDTVAKTLDELRHAEFDEDVNQELQEAFRAQEDILCELDDAMDDAIQAFEAVIKDD